MKLRLALLPIFAAITVVGCTDSPGARKTLGDAGYSEIETTGWALGCGEGDQFATGFRATNPRGQRTEGVVCSGILKRGTIRH